MKLDQLDLMVPDVPAATAFFQDILGLPVQVAEDRFAQIDAGDFVLMLSPDAMVPMAPSAGGIILHFRVGDVQKSLEQVRLRGATVLMEYTRTDWGTESAMIAGPEGVVVDLYHSIEPENKTPEK